MNQAVRRFPWITGMGLLLVILGLSLAFLLAKAKSSMEQRESLPMLAQVADFSLTNQDGVPASLADVNGRVWIADIIFTRCPGPCIRMTHQMKELQDALPKDTGTKLVTLTTDPDYDTPAILKVYSQRAGADPSRWNFLMGTEQQITNLAVRSLKFSAVPVRAEERTSAVDLWVHSTIFVIVDKHGQMRGVFETGGEGVDWPTEKQKILAASKQLEREP